MQQCKKRIRHHQFGCCSIYLRRQLEWPVMHCIMCTQLLRTSDHWGQSRGWGKDTDAVRVMLYRHLMVVLIAFRDWRRGCRRLGNGVAILRKKVIGGVSILRSWQTKNASGIGFTQNLWYSILIFWFFIFVVNFI